MVNFNVTIKCPFIGYMNGKAQFDPATKEFSMVSIEKDKHWRDIMDATNDYFSFGMSQTDREILLQKMENPDQSKHTIIVMHCHMGLE